MVATGEVLRVLRVVGRSHSLLGVWGILKQRLADDGMQAESNVLIGF